MTPEELRVTLRLSDRLGPVPSGARVARQRAQFLAVVRARALAPHTPALTRLVERWRWAAAVSFAMAAASIGFWLVLRTSGEQPRQLLATRDGQVVGEGAWIASSDQVESVTFSEGSQVRLAPHTKARVGRLGAGKADIMLESGALEARITRATGVTWTVAAGPYRVRVVGTAFSVAWDFSRERFEVRVQEGEVRIFGGDLPVDGVSRRAGEALSRSKAATPARALAGLPEPTPAAVETQPPKTQSQPARGLPGNEPSWQGLARAGDYQKALELASRLGLSQLRAKLPADDLLLLANTARYAGNSAAARAAFLELRERTPTHSAARLAAFSLGRLASDSEGDPQQAAAWFRTFLRESPRGDLAAGARARLMNVLLQQGDDAGARAVARDYLTHHPDGPHSESARSLVGAPPSR